jgi:hypothetical protein
METSSKDWVLTPEFPNMIVHLCGHAPDNHEMLVWSESSPTSSHSDGLIIFNLCEANNQFLDELWQVEVVGYLRKAKITAAVEVDFESKSVVIFKSFGYAIIPSYANLTGETTRGG